MQVFLHILTIIGIILLVLIGIIVALLLLVLFFPFLYRARIVKNGELEANASVKWLFGFLTVLASFTGGKLDWNIKVCGFSLRPLLTRPKKPKKPKKKKKAKKQPVIMPGEKADKQVAKDAKAAAKAEIKIQKGKKKPSRDIYEEGEEKPALIERVKEKLISLYEMGKIAVQVSRAYSEVRDKIFKLLRHVMPKKIKGSLIFGFDDPSATGKTYGMICAIYPIIPGDLTLIPDFTRAVLECDLLIKGRIFLIYVLIQGLRIYFNKEVKAAIKQMKK